MGGGGAARGGWLLFCALALAPGAACADNSFEFDFRVGPAVPLADFADTADPGVYLSGTVLARASSTASLGLEVGGNLAHSKGSQDTTIFQLTPVVRLEAPLAGARGKAYLLMGAGYYQTYYEAPTLNQTHSDFGANVGLGFLVHLSTSFLAGFDLRYHHVFESGPDLDYLVPGLLLTGTW